MLKLNFRNLRVMGLSQWLHIPRSLKFTTTFTCIFEKKKQKRNCWTVPVKTHWQRTPKSCVFQISFLIQMNSRTNRLSTQSLAPDCCFHCEVGWVGDIVVEQGDSYAMKSNPWGEKPPRTVPRRGRCENGIDMIWRK